MKIAHCHLASSSQYGQSKYLSDQKPRGTDKDFEDQAWINRAHWNSEGKLFIPGTAFSLSLKEAAKYLGESIPGRGKERYTKHFEAGVMVTQNLILENITKDNILKITLHVPSDGIPGGSKRVIKHFPYILGWRGIVSYFVIDDIISKDVFQKHLMLSGSLIGVGIHRPRNRGTWGRFVCDRIDWEEGEILLPKPGDSVGKGQV